MRDLSLVALCILHAVARGVNHAFAISQLTGIPGGTVHHSLDRMERAGLLISEKEDAQAARTERRSPRRNYAITPEGLAKLNDTLARLRALGRIRRPKLARPPRGAAQ